MTLEIEVSDRVAAWLEREAARHGRSAPEIAADVLAEAAAPSTVEEEILALQATLPKGSEEELRQLAIRQGASLSVRFEDLLGDFWPEDESCDEFLSELRKWRQEEPGRRDPFVQ